MQSGQNFKNHAQRVPTWTIGVLLPFTLNLGLAMNRVIRNFSTETVVNLAMAVAFLIVWWFTRRMALTVQNRVIRLEMRLRLRELLPASMYPDIDRLTVSQLVGLRFASNAELPELVKEVLGGQLSTQTAIKKKVRDWQGDYLRA